MPLNRDPEVRAPSPLHLFGRAIGTRLRGVKGVDFLLRLLHNPDCRQTSWVETIACAVPRGPQYHLSTRWFTEWTTWFYGSQDADMHRWILAHARPDWIAFDVGANFGFYSCILAQLCASAHAFEPVPWLAERTRANARLNELHNLFTREIALADQIGKAELNLPAEDDCNWGTSSLVRSSTGRQCPLNVCTDTIDRYVASAGLERLDFIKIDVEGAEYLVLKGAAHTLDRYSPTIIFERNDESITACVAMLRSLGYMLSTLRNEPLPNRVDQWPHDLLASRRLP